MGYDIYMGRMLLPIAPSKITVNVKNQNKTITLINEGEVNLLKAPGLTEISFTMLLPYGNYPFSRYVNGFVSQKDYLDNLERLKTSMTVFQFIVCRQTPDVRAMYNTDIRVTLEEYSIREDKADLGMDVEVDVKLKQYRSYGTQMIAIDPPTETAPVLVNGQRENATAEAAAFSGKSGGGGYKAYKVQIPGMGVVTVKASSVQDAISKAQGSNWTGTIYVDGQSYYVSKGKLSNDPNAVKKTVQNIAKTVTAVVNAANTVKNTVADAMKALMGGASSKTGRTTTTTTTKTNTSNSGTAKKTN